MVGKGAGAVEPELAFTAEDRLGTMLDGIVDGFIGLDTTCRVTFFNRVSEQYFGIARAKALGSVIWSWFPSLAASDLGRRMIEVMQTRAAQEFEVWCPVFPTHYIAFRVFPTPEGIGLAFRDITERMRTEAELRASRHRLLIATEAARMGVFEWNLADNTVVWEDERLKEIFGRDAPVSPEEFLRDVVDPEDVENVIEPLRRMGTPTDQFEFVCRVRRPDGSPVWVELSAQYEFEGDSPTRLVGIVRDVSDRVLAERRLRLLVNELNHRVKNTLSTVQSYAKLTLRGDGCDPQLIGRFEARLIALSKAHDILTRENWEGADLREIVVNTIAPHNEGAERIHYDGPIVRLSPRIALALSIVVHELGTNASRHGSLSKDGGHVDLRWTAPDNGRRLRLEWVETGGPPVTPPKRRGFGSRMIEEGLSRELQGQVSLRFEPTGLSCVIDIPMSRPPRRDRR